MTPTKNTILNLNTLYIFLVFLFIVIVIIERKLLDLVYLGLITFYYIRIKKYRSSR